MLRNASAINGYAIEASDGDIGTVSDFLFDDTSWLVRWLVVDTGNWLSGRKVLLPPSVVGRVYARDRVFAVKLTMQQVKDSPTMASDEPVSRQMETHIFDYYGWSPYWGTGFYMGGYGYMPGSAIGLPYVGSESAKREEQIADARRSEGDPHLRSIEAVTGYHIHASDGEIGHVEDFLLDEADWSIRYLAVDTKNWWPGKKVLVSPRSTLEIDWSDKLVNLNVDRQKVKDSPAYGALTTVDQAYEESLLKYYGITWIAPADRHPERAAAE
jgi:sporulation protein YlmC with PRC-barrel domain